MSGGLEMLHGTEAVVPLPDGRSIPVSLNLSELVDLGSLENLIKSNISSTLTSGLEKAIFPLSVSKAIPIDLNLVDDKLSNLNNNKEPIDLNPVINKLSNLSTFENLTSDDIGNIITTGLTSFRDKFNTEFSPLNQLANDLSNIVNNNISEQVNDSEPTVGIVNNTTTTNNTELVNLTKNMLQQMTASTQKLDQLVRSIDQTNIITRTNAYSRA